MTSLIPIDFYGQKFFGPHLLMDFFSHSPYLGEIDFWEEFLSKTVTKVGMRALDRPKVWRTDCENAAWKPPEVTGLSGFVPLAESHVGMHTFVEQEYVFMDIFSCTYFDVPEAIAFVEKELFGYRMDTQLCVRGENFPMNRPA